MTALPPGTVTRSQWGARRANHTPRRIAMPSRDGIELHHSVGLYGASTGPAFMRSMQADHLSRNNYADVWYALAIWIDGTILEGRGVDFISSPTNRLTICLAGNYDNRPLTPAQIDAIQTIRAWGAANGLSLSISWHGRRAAVACPGRNVINWARSAPNPTEDPMSWLSKFPSYARKDAAVWATKNTDPNERIGQMSAVRYFTILMRIFRHFSR